MISRRPNRRESTDNAPGPSSAIAAATGTKSIASRAALNTDGPGSGIHDAATARAPAAIATLTTGVRNPSMRELPASAAQAQTRRWGAHESLHSPKHAMPCRSAGTPTATRSSNRPTPGHPRGNLENNLRRCTLSVQPRVSISSCGQSIPDCIPQESPMVGSHL